MELQIKKLGLDQKLVNDIQVGSFHNNSYFGYQSNVLKVEYANTLGVNNSINLNGV